MLTFSFVVSTFPSECRIFLTNCSKPFAVISVGHFACCSVIVKRNKSSVYLTGSLEVDQVETYLAQSFVLLYTLYKYIFSCCFVYFRVNPASSSTKLHCLKT